MVKFRDSGNCCGRTCLAIFLNFAIGEAWPDWACSSVVVGAGFGGHVLVRENILTFWMIS